MSESLRHTPMSARLFLQSSSMRARSRGCLRDSGCTWPTMAPAALQRTHLSSAACTMIRVAKREAEEAQKLKASLSRVTSRAMSDPWDAE